MNSLSAWEQRRKKALLVLPVLVIPFLTLAFWSLGGGSSSSFGNADSTAGFNVLLPQAAGKKEVELDKLRFYEAADQDSAEWRRKMAQDRYSLGYRDEPHQEYEPFDKSASAYNPAPPPHSPAATEKLIYQKLGAINQQLQQAEQAPANEGLAMQHKYQMPADPVATPSFPNSGREPFEDKELTELNQMMDKILDIQHPDRVKARLQEVDTIELESQHSVVSMKPDSRIAHFGAKRKRTDRAAFYSTHNADTEADQEPLIMAVLHNRQEVVQGSIVPLRTLQTCYVNGSPVPAGSMVHGAASIKEGRLMIHVSSLVLDNRLYPVAFKVYDLDGLEGLHIPGAPGRKTIDESLGNSFQSIPLLAMDPSIRGQAATAGVQAVKALVGKKVRQLKVVLPSGYRVMLKQSK